MKAFFIETAFHVVQNSTTLGMLLWIFFWSMDNRVVITLQKLRI
jgi:hypothetical protein